MAPSALPALPHHGTRVPFRPHHQSIPTVHAPIQQLRRLVALSAGPAKGFGAKPADPSKLAGQTCPCGSKARYAECCEPFHKGQQPETAEQQLRARFSAFVKGEEDYVVRTFHETYLPFKYPYITDPEERQDQLKRDVKMACSSYEFSGLKVISHQPSESGDEATIEFTYKSRQRTREKRTNSRHTRVKAGPVDKNLDGSVKVEPTVERSKFIRDPQRGWLFSEFELVKFPEWMAEAKEAELASRKLREEQQPQQ